MTEQSQAQDVVIENEDDFKFTPKLGVNTVEPLNIGLNAGLQTFIILNQEINISVKVFDQLWTHSKLKIAVDGGADRLLQYCEKNGVERFKYKPDYIIGDFDSVKQETLVEYEKQGVRTIHQETQYSTDLMKLLSLCNLVLYFGYQGEQVDEYDGIAQLEALNLLRFEGQLEKNKIFFIGGIGGRLDQTLHSISVLYKSKDTHSHLEIYFFNKDFEDLSLIVHQGENFVRVPFHDKRIVGLLPFGPEVVLTTKGLKWDVVNWSSRIDTKVSSSNHIVNDTGFYIETDRSLIINIALFEQDFE